MSYKNNQEKSKGMTRRVTDMPIIVIDNNNTNEGNTMNKFNEKIQVEETNEYQTGELMNELNKQNEIQVGDKVKWLHGFQALRQQCFGHVVSTDEKVMGNPCFLVKECGDHRQSIKSRETMVSKDKVSKVS